MNRIFAPAAWFFQRLVHFTRAVAGDISWRPPGWAGALGRGGGKRPVLSGASILGLIVLFVAGWWSWNWYVHQPKPTTVDWTVNLDPLPAPGAEFQPQSLTLTFDRSMAKLESIGKDVTSRVSLSPRINGRWSWSGGTRLVFLSSGNWPAATRF